jgi:Cysteine-rich secretory protein family
MSRIRSTTTGLVAGVLVLALSLPASSAAADAHPAFIATDADWLTTVNYFREMSGLAPVTEDPAMSSGAYQHSCYMLANGISHDEVPGKPGYTAEGDAAGNSGNVAVSTAYGAAARTHIELWMTGPFHAIGVLRPNLRTAGFGKCDNQSTPRWHSGATLDVLRGLGPRSPQSAPILFPGDGTTTSLNRFIVETPDPLAYCGWSDTAGLPVIALMPESVGGSVSASISGPSGPLETCALSQLNTDGVAQQILQGDNAVVAIPRAPLSSGTYTVTVATQARTVAWSFTVDPLAALGPAPMAQAEPTGPAVGFRPLVPTRVADTRENFGATRLVGGVQKRIQITGRGGVPTGTDAVSANFTVVGPTSPGYLTVWNCSSTRPVVSTSNFNAGDVAPNAATIPLDSTGGLCVYSNVSTDLVIDVNGRYGASGDSRFTPVAPVRLMDTRETGNRLADGQTVELTVAGVGGVPVGVAAVTLNVTSVDPSLDGYVTVYACGDERPVVSNLNPHQGQVRPNLVVTPVSADGKVCLYSLQDVDLVVDVTGYLKPGNGKRFTPSTPFRLIDTRDRSRPELQAGTGGAPVRSGQTVTIQIAGVRGVPSSAQGVSLNLTVTGASRQGFITAWPCGDRPTTSTANYEAAQAVSNGAQLPLSSTGALCVYSMQDAHVIIDVNGWWS